MKSKNIGEISKNEIIKIFEEGWSFIPQNTYKISSEKKSELQDYYNDLLPDPYGEQRYRSYLKLDMNLATKNINVSEEQSYSQTQKANNIDGGKKRYFDKIPSEVFFSEAFNEIVQKNISNVVSLFEFNKNEITIGLHCVRYSAKMNKPSFSSPVWLHKDDEPIVIVNVINESDNLIGGDSIIAKNHKTITSVSHIKPFEGLFLTKKCLHAVSPMACSGESEEGIRDILLTTIEEKDEAVQYKKFNI